MPANESIIIIIGKITIAMNGTQWHKIIEWQKYSIAEH